MSEAGRYVCDESDWPLVRVQAPAVAADESGFRELLDRYTGLLRRGKPFVLMFELGVGAPLSAERRDELRRHAREHHHLLVRNQSGLVIVARSAFHRATARALIWLVRPPYPVEVSSDWQSARSWAMKRTSARATALAS
jgi:hypothetical protein